MVERYQRRKAMIIHPAYSTDDKLWFTEEDVTARSLAELQAKLPNAVIEGYYPEGYEFERVKHTYPNEMQRTPFRATQARGSNVSYAAKRRAAKPVVAEPEPELPLEEATADLGSVKFPAVARYRPEAELEPNEPLKLPPFLPVAPVPAATEPVKEPPVATGKKIRYAGQPRRSIWTEKAPEFMRLFKAGASINGMATALGVTTNAIIGYGHRKGLVFSSRKPKNR